MATARIWLTSTIAALLPAVARAQAPAPLTPGSYEVRFVHDDTL